MDIDSSVLVKNYWWLNASPNIWSFASIGIGEVIDYSLCNEAGNKRRIYQNFIDAEAGDLVIGYESSPVKKIVCLLKVSKENDGEKVYFEKLEELSSPINYSDIIDKSELKEMEYFTNDRGTLFKLTKEEYDFLLVIIRERNPVLVLEINSEDTQIKDNFLKEGNSILDNLYNGQLGNSPPMTPRWLVREMLNSLPEEVWDSKHQFLDWTCRSGVFLEEVMRKLFVSEQFNKDLLGYSEEEKLKHIREKQLYAIVFGEYAEYCQSIIQRRLWGRRGDVENVKHVVKFREWVKEGKVDVIKNILEGMGLNMKFTVIIGNPPYQEMTGGGKEKETEDALPLYDKFVKKSIELKAQYIVQVIPNRWALGGKKELEQFRELMIKSKRLKSIYSFSDTQDVFDDIGCRGGVMYFLYDSQNVYECTQIINCKKENGILVYSEPELRKIDKYKYVEGKKAQEVFMLVLDNKAEAIVGSLSNKIGYKSMISDVSTTDPFGVDGKKNMLYTDIKDGKEQYEVITSENFKGGYILKECAKDSRGLIKNELLIAKYNVCTGEKQHGSDKWPMIILREPFILDKGQICTRPFIILGSFDKKEEAENMITYLKTKFCRFLISAAMSGHSMRNRQYLFVPIQDYSKSWTDQELYEKYDLTVEEIQYIESKIKAWD